LGTDAIDIGADLVLPGREALEHDEEGNEQCR
jgi:hypothetical protein